MKNFNEFINEEISSNNFVYHCTDIESAISILKDNKILGFVAGNYGTDERDKISKSKVISVTRNKFFNFGSIQFKLDLNKIKQNYKIVPYQESMVYKTRHINNDLVAEEVIIANFLDLSKYCLEIDIVTSTLKEVAIEEIGDIYAELEDLFSEEYEKFLWLHKQIKNNKFSISKRLIEIIEKIKHENI